MSRIAKNTFSKGLNKDLDVQNVQPEYYIDAHNLSIVQEGKFLSAKDFPGTLSVSSVTNGINTLLDANVKTVYGEYTIGTTINVRCLTFFITGYEAGSLGAFYITAYDIDHSVFYYLFKQQGLPADYFTEHRIVDTRQYSENGVDIIYFTDNYNEMRRLRCYIPTGSADYFINEYDLSLQRRGANGTIIALPNISGSLLSGTYQYAYRMVDPVRNKLTKWSSLSNPTHVYSTGAPQTPSPVYSSVGLPTNQGVFITVTPTPIELAQYSFYQLAVVENVYASTSAVQPASILPITAVGSPITFSHKTNQKIGTTLIDDIVVDLAGIQSAKTLAIKQSRLFAGNINYVNLQMDNGAPTASGSILTTTTGLATNNSYADQIQSSVNRGYFRDELYRFGIVYRDKYGNKSPVQVLNLNGITDNQNTTTGPDVRFPGRFVNNRFALFSRSDGKIQSLGLQLSAIHNHPSWAVGFEIVRVKRIKKILFQTPVIPMTTVQGTGALAEYPSQAVTIANNAANALTPTAQPGTNTKVYVPKNLFWPELREIVPIGYAKNVGDQGVPLNGNWTTQDVTLTNKDQNSNPIVNYSYANIFPQSTLYGDTPYRFTGAESLRTVDYCLAKLNLSNFNPVDPDPSIGTIVPGDSYNTKVSGTFYSLSDADYYFDSNWASKSIQSISKIQDYQAIDNLSQGIVFGGNSMFDFAKLYGEGVNFGTQPNAQKSAVVALSSALSEPYATSLTFSGGVLNAKTLTSGNYIIGSSGPQYNNVNVVNNFVNTYSAYSADNSYVQCFRIANVVNSNGDDRYGDINAPHEFISTGASYAFSNSELATVQAKGLLNIDVAVFGGDCFVGPHTFKVADSSYSVVNQNKYFGFGTADSSDALVKKWKKYFVGPDKTTGTGLPIGLSGAAQFVEVILESEYNGSVMNQDVLQPVIYVNNKIPVMNLSTTVNTEGTIHSPLLYTYNLNLSKQNDQKVYLPIQTYNFIQYLYKSRIAYSDLKIYDSDVQGFDVFRVASTFDLEENKGALTKLAISEDNMYAIQESGVVYLPTGQVQVEQTDGGTLAVGTGDVISRPNIIDQYNGCQHLDSVSETGTAIYFPNVNNKEIYRLSGFELKNVSDDNMATQIRNQFSDTVPENKLIGVFDQDRDEYWLIDNKANLCFVYNEKLQAWASNYEFLDPTDSLSSACVGGTYGNNRLYITSKNISGGFVSLGVHSMYRGANGTMFGRSKTPRITFVVNEDSDISKTFDDLMFVASDRLASMDLTIQRENSLSNQTVTGTTLDNLSIEGNYRVKTLRDVNKARLRGLVLLATIYWKPGNTTSVSLTSAVTKYRFSARTPY